MLGFHDWKLVGYDASRFSKTLELSTELLSIICRSKKLEVALARKWKTMAGFGRRTISINRKPARAGHFVVYSSDKRRFVVPLAYLRTKVFQELLRLSEEEFGMPKDGPITLPCDAAVL
ncbi:hypothetical protein Goarm_009024, partial [Gossypium armourianum]|nr:hypothetical protein [Gossypium armourianum]